MTTPAHPGSVLPTSVHPTPSAAPGRRRVLAALAGVALALTACTPADERRRLLVHAAASLDAPFRALAAEFERAHPEVRVELNFAGSSDLVAQLREGAPGDVLATADQRTMDALPAELLAAPPRTFARNVLTVITRPGNPRGIRTLADLAQEGLDVATCAPAVPCGAIARRLLEAESVPLQPVTEEASVAGVVAKVESGQVDAGLAYRTDALAAGDAVTAVELPGAASTETSYPLAPLARAGRAEDAAAFVDLVLSERGRAVLAEHGFLLP